MNNILVVEDDPRLNSNISELLQAEGYITNSAGNGFEALKLIKKGRPSLIISDIMMPMMNGLELIRHLQSNSTTSSIPFIFLSAKNESNDIRHGLNKGADDYITKPFKSAELLNAVSNCLRKNENVIHSPEEMGGGNTSKVPHELWTPLVSVFGYCDLIIDEIESLSRDEIKNYVKIIRGSGEKIHERVEKFLIYNELDLLNKGKESDVRINNENYSADQEEKIELMRPDK